MHVKKPHKWIFRLINPHIIEAALICSISLCVIHIYSEMISKSNNDTIQTEIVFNKTPIEIFRGDLSKKQVIFTFDGGDGAQSADTIIEILAKHNVKGTFFLTGRFVENNPTIVKNIMSSGGEIFNHTYNHLHLTQLPDGRIAQELSLMQESLKVIIGVSSKPYFRAPYGETDQRVLDAAARAGYQSVKWSSDALDWKESVGMTANVVKKKILDNVRPGEIFLMHVGDNITGVILDDVFKQIKSMGYKIVSLSEGL